MTDFSYTVTPKIKTLISEIDTLRSHVALSLITPREEQRWRYEASNARVYYVLLLSGFNIHKRQIVDILQPNRKRGMSIVEKTAVKYKRVFNYLYQDWYASRQHVGADEVIQIEKMFTHPKLRIGRETLENMLTFMQIEADHPVVQAGLGYILPLTFRPFNEEQQYLHHVLPLLFLYKHGYYYQGMLDIGEYLFHDKQYVDNLLKESAMTRNYTMFLEYFALLIRKQAEKIYVAIRDRQFETDFPDSYFVLSERQKMILESFDEPGKRITNRKIQEVFRVSQITASRDLTKLAELGLLHTAGKGRSVYYTKV